MEDAKRAKAIPRKSDRLYPSLSDMESSNTNSDREQYFSTSEMPSKMKNVRFEHTTQPYSSQEEDNDDDR